MKCLVISKILAHSIWVPVAVCLSLEQAHSPLEIHLHPKAV